VSAFSKENPDIDEIDFLAILSPIDLCHLGHDDNDVQRLIKAVGIADVVFIDTLSRALNGGNENAPDDMGAFIGACDALREALKCTVIVVHHQGKDAERGARGHNSLFCAVDTEVSVSRTDGLCRATVSKQRDLPNGGEIVFKLRSIHLGDNKHGEPVTSCVVEETDAPASWAKASKPLTGQRKDLLDALDAAVASHGVEIGMEAKAVTREQWHEQVKASGRFADADLLKVAWNRVRENLIKEQLVGHRPLGDYFWRRDPYHIPF
jgi:hypothetical protein